MKIGDDWDDTRERLREVVKMRGADAVAREIPASRSTVFRLLNSDDVPQPRTIECIERMLDEKALREARRFE